MRIELSIPSELVAFADSESRRRGLTRSAYLGDLLRSKQVRMETRRYLDSHGWDVAGDESAWREHQRRSMHREYADDEW